MNCISRILERVWGSNRGAKQAKRLKNRSLRMESLEDRALLSVTTPSAAEARLDAAYGGAALVANDFTGGTVDSAVAVPVTAAEAERNVVDPVFDLAEWSQYATFKIDVNDSDGLCLFGLSGSGQWERLYPAPGNGNAAANGAAANKAAGTLTVYSDNSAREVTFTNGALQNFSEILYVGGSKKNDTVVLEGSDLGNVTDFFSVSQETRVVDVHERQDKVKTQKVVFDAIDTYSLATGPYDVGATVKVSGTSSVVLDGKAGKDEFIFEKLGTTYELIGGEGVDILNFGYAMSSVKIDMGKATAQSVLSGQKGKIRLHDDIEYIHGTPFSDKITTTASIKTVRGMGGSDTVNLVGAKDAEGELPSCEVYLDGEAQKVTGKGYGNFNVSIGDMGSTTGSKSTVNMSSVKGGRAQVDAWGNKIKVVGSKGDDIIGVAGDDADIRGNDGDDRITLRSLSFENYSANAKVRGDKGNDYIDCSDTTGKCTLDGGEGDDYIIAGLGNDVLKAGSGFNILFGGSGADKLTGGRDRDLLIANTAIGVINYEWSYYENLMKYWVAGNVDEVIKITGTESVADKEADVLKRGGGKDNLFFANPDDDLEGSDFDIVDYKKDKGDLLYTDKGLVTL